MITCRAKVRLVFETEVVFKADSESIREIIAQAERVARHVDVSRIGQDAEIEVLGVMSDGDVP